MPLHIATKLMNYEIVKILVDNGADINQQDIHGYSPLYRAIDRGDTNAVTYFVKHKARTDLVTEKKLNALNLAQQNFQNSVIEILTGKSPLLKVITNELIVGPYARFDMYPNIDDFPIPRLPATDPFDGPKYPEREYNEPETDHYQAQPDYRARFSNDNYREREPQEFERPRTYNQHQRFTDRNLDRNDQEQPHRNQEYSQNRYQNDYNRDSNQRRNDYRERNQRDNNSSKFEPYTPESSQTNQTKPHPQEKPQQVQNKPSEKITIQVGTQKQAPRPEQVQKTEKLRSTFEKPQKEKPILQVGVQKQVPKPPAQPVKEKPQNVPKPSDFVNNKSDHQEHRPPKKKERSTPDFTEYRGSANKRSVPDFAEYRPQQNKFNIEVKKNDTSRLEIVKSSSTNDIPKEEDNKVRSATTKSGKTITIEKPTLIVQPKAVEAPKPSILEKSAFKIQFPDKGQKLQIPKLNITIAETTKKEEFISCPACSFISAKIEYLLEHFIQSHHMTTDFEDKFLLSKSTKTQTAVCSVCNGEFPITQFRIHVCRDHTNDVLLFIGDMSNTSKISAFCRKQLKPAKNEEEEKTEKIEKQDETKSDEKSDESEELSEVSSDEELSDVSSGYSEDSDDPEAEAYMAFVTSTIDMKGLSAAKKSEKDNEEIIVQKQEVKEEVINEPVKEEIEAVNYITLLENLDYVEKLMTSAKFIQINPVPHCCLCQKDFTSTVSLMKHCMDNHTPKFTPQFLKVLDFIIPGITFEKSDNELLIDQNLNISLCCYPTLKCPTNPRVEYELSFPNLLASLIVEALAADNPQPMIFPKYFDNTVLMLKIPVQTPFVVTTYENETVFGIVSTPHLSADKIKNILNQIAEYQRNLSVLAIRYTNISDDGMIDDDIYNIANMQGCHVLRSEISYDQDLKSFDSFFFCSSWTEQTKENIKNDIGDIFYNCEICQCGKCGQTFRHNDESLCNDGEPHTADSTISSAEFFEFIVDEFQG